MKNDFFDDEFLKNVMVNRAYIEEGLGFSLSENSINYPDLNSMSVNDLYDFSMKTISFIGYLNEFLTKTRKRELDGEVFLDKLLADKINILSSNGAKSTGIKDLAKSDSDYVTGFQMFNTLRCYREYLERLISSIDKLHYVIKQKITTETSDFRKSNNGN